MDCRKITYETKTLPESPPDWGVVTREGQYELQLALQMAVLVQHVDWFGVEADVTDGVTRQKLPLLQQWEDEDEEETIVTDIDLRKITGLGMEEDLWIEMRQLRISRDATTGCLVEKGRRTMAPASSFVYHINLNRQPLDFWSTATTVANERGEMVEVEPDLTHIVAMMQMAMKRYVSKQTLRDLRKLVAEYREEIRRQRRSGNRTMTYDPRGLRPRKVYR